MASVLPSNQRAIQFVLFDLGDTLIYFDGVWHEVMARSHQDLLGSLRQAGVDLDAEPFLGEFNRRLDAYYQQRESEFIEYTTLFVLKTLLAEMGYRDIKEDRLRNALADMYRVFETHWKIEADTLSTLEVLKDRGYRMGVLSNATDDRHIQNLVDRAGIRPFFDFVLSSAGVTYRKPHPGIFQMALGHWKASPDRAVMIGDKLGADILGARNAGIKSVWLTRRADSPGNRDHLDTIVPDAVIASLGELPALLERWNAAV